VFFAAGAPAGASTPWRARRGHFPPDDIRPAHDAGFTMKMSNIPFGTTDWSDVERTEHAGDTGMAYWRTRQFGDLRVRMVEYTAGYLADHWCSKGHILFCLEGELHTELEDGRQFVLTPGMSYQVADQAEPHRSSTATGAKLFIVD
jgi:quercetin dioxygenase-like cupin family protein